MPENISTFFYFLLLCKNVNRYPSRVYYPEISLSENPIRQIAESTNWQGSTVELTVSKMKRHSVCTIDMPHVYILMMWKKTTSSCLRFNHLYVRWRRKIAFKCSPYDTNRPFNPTNFSSLVLHGFLHRLTERQCKSINSVLWV